MSAQCLPSTVDRAALRSESPASHTPPPPISLARLPALRALFAQRPRRTFCRRVMTVFTDSKSSSSPARPSAANDRPRPDARRQQPRCQLPFLEHPAHTHHVLHTTLHAFAQPFIHSSAVGIIPSSRAAQGDVARASTTDTSCPPPSSIRTLYNLPARPPLTGLLPSCTPARFVSRMLPHAL